jgi:hypothetical protein
MTPVPAARGQSFTKRRSPADWAAALMALLPMQGMPRPRDREGAFTSEDWVGAVIRLIGQVRNRCLSRRPGAPGIPGPEAVGA